MIDSELWKLAIADLRQELSTLDQPSLDKVKEAAVAITSAKTEIFKAIADVDCQSVCAECRGECCITGKYHVTVIDVMVMLTGGLTLFEPSFGNGRCPYLGKNGCLMPPAYRPYNCITFHCERIEGLCEPLILAQLVKMDEQLRIAYKRFEGLFGRRLWEGLLHAAERDILPFHG